MAIGGTGQFDDDPTAWLLARGDSDGARAGLLVAAGDDPVATVHAAASLLRAGRGGAAVRIAADAATAGGGGRAVAIGRLVADAVAVARGTRPGWVPPAGDHHPADATLWVLTAGMAAVWAEAYDAALAACDAATTPAAVAAAGVVRGLVAFRTGEWATALQAASDGRARADHLGLVALVEMADAVLVTVEAATGDADACRARAMALLSRDCAPPTVRASALTALGLLELGEGDPACAAGWLEVLRGHRPADGRRAPGTAMWEVDLAEAYAATGRRAEAAALLDALATRAERAGDERAGLAVTRCRAVLCDRPDEAIATLRRVADRYAGPRWAFARARTQVHLGERLLAVGDDRAAAEALADAAAGFAALGARGWQRQTAAMLGRARAAGPLTRLEARVAAAAGLGSPTDVIAAGLAMSHAEVEALLAAAIGKLGVDGPAQLGPRVAELAALGVAGPPSVAVQVRLLGGFAVLVDGAPVDLRQGVGVRAVRRLALGGPIGVDDLVDELWPGVDRDTGRQRLRSVLTRLRRAAPGLVERTGDTLALGADVVVDAVAFERAATAALSEPADRLPAAARVALDQYGALLLPDDGDVEVVSARERLRRLRLALLDALAAAAAARGDVDGAVAAYDEAARLDPYDELRRVRAAEVQLAAGRPAAALASLRDAELAARRLGVAPPPAVEALRRAARAARPGAAERAATKLGQ